jgi:chemotaxis protein MotB
VLFAGGFVTAKKRDRWMVSYLDVLTILLILFIAAAARTAQPPTAPAPAPTPSILLEVQKKLEREGLETRLETRGLIVSLPQAILFASGDDRITAEALPMVARLAEIVRDIPNQVSLEGNADAVPIHNHRFKNNWELSAARGISLLDVFATQFGIPESRLSVASYGSNRPSRSNETEDGRASNRRVEIAILDAR